MCARIGIRMYDPTRYENTVETLKRITDVLICHLITGEYNMMLKVYCLNNEHLMQILFEKILTIEGVLKTETFISLVQSFSRQIDVKYLE